MAGPILEPGGGPGAAPGKEVGWLAAGSFPTDRTGQARGRRDHSTSRLSDGRSILSRFGVVRDVHHVRRVGRRLAPWSAAWGDAVIDRAELQRQEDIGRVNRVIDYIRENLTDDLRLETLAQVANFSPYHFHRVFKAMAGDVRTMRIPGGLFAVAHVEIDASEYGDAWDCLVGEWMPDHAVESDVERMCYEMYLNDPNEHPESTSSTSASRSSGRRRQARAGRTARELPRRA